MSPSDAREAPPRQNCLTKADELTAADRQEMYGHPFLNFTRIARGWEVILNVAPGSITPEQVAAMNIWQKVAREIHRHSPDNPVDIAGYARTLEMIKDYRRGLDEKVVAAGRVPPK